MSYPVFSAFDGQKMPEAGVDRVGGKEAGKLVAMDVAGAGVATDAGSVSSNLYDEQVGFCNRGAISIIFLSRYLCCDAWRYRRPKMW